MYAPAYARTSLARLSVSVRLASRDCNEAVRTTHEDPAKNLRARTIRCSQERAQGRTLASMLLRAVQATDWMSASRATAALRHLPLCTCRLGVIHGFLSTRKTAKLRKARLRTFGKRCGATGRWRGDRDLRETCCSMWFSHLDLHGQPPSRNVQRRRAFREGLKTDLL
ncbi:hypothetical protein FA95DRAFT_930002 [Auriscalpium vulgare]|uniref:Uncharacterized protein n=1 Tax=Auriscalpium vulgare TaxID=40419 RepID=A0ACB8R7D8_9AGAM|nr:hypothetical protein FA95DRAFT_930002 [Auriscalpium vulgare]